MSESINIPMVLVDVYSTLLIMPCVDLYCIHAHGILPPLSLSLTVCVITYTFDIMCDTHTVYTYTSMHTHNHTDKHNNIKIIKLK